MKSSGFSLRFIRFLSCALSGASALSAAVAVMPVRTAAASAECAALVPMPEKFERLPGHRVLPSKSCIVFRHDGSLPAEGYRLSVTEKGVTVTSSGAAGRVWALQTVKQLGGDTRRDALDVSPGLKLPCCTVEDAPRFRWRGYMLDVSRHFFDAAAVKRVLDTMAYHKFNVFHWHLTDVLGWRFPVPEYPQLTNACAVRVNGPRDRTWIRNERPGRYGPYAYTAEEIRDVVAYASARGIKVIPEIDIPGHQCINGEFRFSCSYSGLPPVGTNQWHVTVSEICPGNKEGIRFYEKVFDEVCRLFPSDIVHIGGDEVGGIDWKRCPRCLAVMKEHGLKDTHELQHHVMKHFVEYLAAKGRRAMGWNEILRGGEMRRSTLMSHYTGPVDRVVSAVKKGHDVVMMPASYTYFDCDQGLADDPHDLYQFFNPRADWRTFYRFDPLKGIPPEHSERILGLQGCSWTEIACTESDVEWGAHPRLACLAETAWAYPASRDCDAFGKRLAVHRDRLVAMGVGAAPVGPLRPLEPVLEPRPAFMKLWSFTTVLQPELTESCVKWVTDETVPAGGYAVVIKYDFSGAPGTITARTSDEAGKKLALKILGQMQTRKNCGVFTIPAGEIRSYR